MKIFEDKMFIFVGVCYCMVATIMLILDLKYLMLHLGFGTTWCLMLLLEKSKTMRDRKWKNILDVINVRKSLIH